MNQSPPANRKHRILAAVVLLWAAAAGACATTGRGPSMGCLDPLAADCKDPSALAPLTAQLPTWPFPRLIKPLPEESK